MANEKASVVLLVDVSGSMRATDVKPTRLAAAKRAMLSFLDQAPDSLRIGVVSFSDKPAVIVSPTTDRNVLTKGIDLLRPQMDTAIGDAIVLAVDLRPHHNPYAGRGGEDRGPSGTRDAKGRALRVDPPPLSDGAQNFAGYLSPGQGAERAHTAGIQVYTITLGTDGGTI